MTLLHWKKNSVCKFLSNVNIFFRFIKQTFLFSSIPSNNYSQHWGTGENQRAEDYDDLSLSFDQSNLDMMKRVSSGIFSKLPKLPKFQPPELNSYFDIEVVKTETPSNFVVSLIITPRRRFFQLPTPLRC